jgi:hypothetical protein
MGWAAYAFIILLLLVFNIYVADGMIRIQRDVKQIHKTLLDRKNY